MWWWVHEIGLFEDLFSLDEFDCECFFCFFSRIFYLHVILVFTQMDDYSLPPVTVLVLATITPPPEAPSS